MARLLIVIPLVIAGIYCCPCPPGNKHSWFPGECGKSLQDDSWIQSVLFDGPYKNHPLARRIVGGRDAMHGQFPWQVSLQLDGRHFCGGVVVNHKWVLTAAHCVYGQSTKRVTVLAGVHDVNVTSDAEQRSAVRQIYTHPYYSFYTYEHDVALLKLRTPLVLNSYVMPACSPDIHHAYVGADAVLSGWGVTRSEVGGGNEKGTVLRWIVLPIQSNGECNEHLSERITANMMCAGHLPLTSHNTCQGDSGGPLIVVANDDTFTLVGIVSRSDGCDGGMPNIYTRIANYLPWISETIEVTRH